MTIDVVVSGRRGRSRNGIRAHSSTSLLRRDLTTVDRIPCTSVARTLLDLAPLVDRRALERAFDRALTLRVFDLGAIQDNLSRSNCHPGALLLRAVLMGHRIGSTETQSDLEEDFLAICDAAGIPRPKVNHTIDVDGEPVTVDFAWISERLIVEADSWRYHGNPIALARDNYRTRKLTLMGWCVLRVTASDFDDWGPLAHDLRTAHCRSRRRLP